jgi:hypothetical protein
MDKAVDEKRLSLHGMKDADVNHRKSGKAGEGKRSDSS